MTPNKSKANKTILNPKIKPDLLRNNEWQALLRKQFAHIQKLKVNNVGNETFYSDFDVFNPLTKNKYKVAIRSITEPKNFCSCYDFKTNKLGTCKHIEAVFFYLESLPNFEALANSITEKKHTSIYVDYLNHRKIKIRIGLENTQEIKNITNHFFDDGGFLIEENVLELCSFIEDGKAKYNIIIYSDANELIDAIADNQNRITKLNHFDFVSELNILNNCKLHTHQLKTASFILANAKVIVSAEPGLGTGITTLAAIQLARKYFSTTKILVVTDNKYYWENKIETFLNEKTILIAGNDYNRKKAIETLPNAIKITSFNNASLDVKWINELNFDFVVFDDASAFDNLNNAICKQLKNIKSTFMLLLSNLDLTNNLEAFYSQIQAVDMYLPGSIFNFINRYAIKNAQGKIVATKNSDELMQHLKRHYFRIEFDNVANEIETKLSKKISVKLNAQHQQHYDSYVSENAHDFVTKSNEQQQFIIDNLNKLATSSFLFNKTNCESKLPILLEILRRLKSNTYNVLITSSWFEYSNFIDTFLQQNNFEISNSLNSKISIKCAQDLNAEMVSKYDVTICLDANSNVVLYELLFNNKPLNFVLVADDTFEESVYKLSRSSETDIIDATTNYFKNITKPVQQTKPVIQNIQLSFLGDDDIEENVDNTVDEIIDLFNDLEIKLTQTDIRKKVMLDDNTPKHLKMFLKLFES